MKLFGNLFRKKEFDEDEYVEQLASENAAEGSDSEDVVAAAQVIRYVFKKDGTPEIVSVSEWHSNLIPDVGSIVWARTDGRVVPYVVKRIDYMEDEPDGAGYGILIAVRSASRDEVARGVY